MQFNPKLLKSLESKLKDFNLPSDNFGSFLADLNDLTEASYDYIEEIKRFLDLDAKDKDSTGRTLIELQTIMEHFQFHVSSALPIIEKIVNDFYDELDE